MNTGFQDLNVTELTVATARSNPLLKRMLAKHMKHSWVGPHFLDARTGRASPRAAPRVKIVRGAQ